MPMKRHDGFAIVEVLIGLLVLSIVVAVVLMTLLPSNHKGATAQCKADARAIASAVKVYNERHHEKTWPDLDTSSKVPQRLPLIVIATNLQYFGGLDMSDPLRHLDGSQRIPVSQAHGWKYVYETHTTDATNCGT
jgi:type II secretory pathway pseudopilin PulG